MIQIQKIRRPMLALIAGSALLLGGAAMPKFCFQNPTLLYAIGEIRMTLGDQQGGLQTIGYAAQLKDRAAAGTTVASTAPATVSSTSVETAKCTRTPVVKVVSARKTTPVVVAVKQTQPSADQFVKLAKLVPADFANGFDQRRFVHELHRTAYIERTEQIQQTLAKVRSELERQGIAVPPAVPVPPIAVTVAP